MEEKGFSQGVLLHQAWKIFKSNWLFLIFVYLVGYAILLIPSFLQIYFNKPSAFFQGVFTVLSILVSLFIMLGWIKISLRLAKGEKRSFLDLFRGFPLILNLLVAQLLVLIVTIAATILTFALIASPGIILIAMSPGGFEGLILNNYWLALAAVGSFLLATFGMLLVFYNIILRFILVPYFIVDYYEGPIEAMKMSNRASRGVKWDLLSMLFITIVLVLLGLLFFVVGFFASIAISYLLYALAYNELVETTPWKSTFN